MRIERKEIPMEDTAYHYLDEERKKLWEELRRTQAQLATFIEASSGDQASIEKGLRSLSAKAARAYNKIVERDNMSEIQAKELAVCLEKSKEVTDQITSDSESLKSVSDSIQDANKKVKDGLVRFDEQLGSINSRATELEKQIDAIGQFVESSNQHRDELQEKVDDFSEKYEDEIKKHAEISKLHSLLFGYTKSDGEIVEGRKQELERVYEALEQKIASTKASAESFEADYKRQITEFLTTAKTEAESLSCKVRGLLPDAMTAGLCAAYQENRQMEEQEQSKQLTTFKWCIGGMMALSLLPIVVNLCLWFFCGKSFLDILTMLPREMMYILPIYVPLFWLAIFANKRVNLSKRLIEEYKHKEAVSKTYEGLSKQIAELDDDATSRELRARLLYNTVMLSEKNPGELIKNFNRPDNPLIDVLNQGTKFSEAISKLKQFPGFDGIVGIANSLSQKTSDTPKTKEEDET